VLGNSTGISINSSSGASSGSSGQVTITTYASQPVPQNFLLTSDVRNVVALPGGLFTASLAGPVNGTAGSIVSGSSLVNNANGGRLVAGAHDFGTVDINIVGGGVQITRAGGPVTIDPDNGSGVRTFVTPAEAMALFQKSRGDGKTIFLNGAG